jgi:glycosyltransferase involved in cell wall biosynthesis
MKVIPFLNKNTQKGMRRISKLLLESHFLLLPTRAEAFGIVFCEASAYGLPSISTDTGGVSGVVSEGRNGYLLPHSASGKEYADVIASCFSDNSRYEQLRRTSREEYESRLNWDAWGRAAAEVLRQVLYFNTKC